MRTQVDDYEIIVENFSSIAECTDYFYDELGKLQTMRDREIFTKREFKTKKKYLMNQMNGNLKLLKNRDEFSRKEENSKLKELKKQNKINNKKEISIKNQIEPKETPKQLEPVEPIKQIEPGSETYQIEDKSNETTAGNFH